MKRIRLDIAFDDEIYDFEEWLNKFKNLTEEVTESVELWTEQKSLYKVKDVVYHKLHEDRRPGFILAVIQEVSGFAYKVQWPDYMTDVHQEFELSSTYNPGVQDEAYT